MPRLKTNVHKPGNWTNVPALTKKSKTCRWISECADRLVGRINRSITMGKSNSNEHDTGYFHECIMFCISIGRMSIFIMLSLGRRRAVSPIHITLRGVINKFRDCFSARGKELGCAHRLNVELSLLFLQHKRQPETITQCLSSFGRTSMCTGVSSHFWARS